MFFILILYSCTKKSKGVLIGECKQDLIIIKEIIVEEAILVNLKEEGGSLVIPRLALAGIKDYSLKTLIEHDDSFILGSKVLAIFGAKENLFEDYIIDCDSIDLYKSKKEVFEKYDLQEFSTKKFLLGMSSINCINKYSGLNKKGKVFIENSSAFGDALYVKVVIPICD